MKARTRITTLAENGPPPEPAGVLYAGAGSLAYLAMAAMALAGLGLALLAGRLSRSQGRGDGSVSDGLDRR